MSMAEQKSSPLELVVVVVCAVRKIGKSRTTKVELIAENKLLLTILFFRVTNMAFL